MSKFSMASVPNWLQLPSWLYNENGGNTFYIVVCVLALVACLAIVFFSGSKDDKKKSTRSVAFGGVMLALSTVLSMIRIYRMPQGGSITLASVLPLAIYAYAYGLKKGVLVGFAYGMLQALLEGWIIHPVQFLLDYPIAFATVGIVGAAIFKKLPQKVALPVGLAVAIVVRYCVHSLGGMVFFAEYAANQTFGAIFVYSFGYNAFCLLDGVIAIAIAFVLSANKGLMRQLTDFATR